MVRKATLLPLEAKEVEWVRYTGDNFDEIEHFINKSKTNYDIGDKFYRSTKGDDEIYWKDHGFIRKGDFVVAGMEPGKYRKTSPDGLAIISWKTFPHMISEEIPIYLDEYREWLQNLTED